jgi:hypothetical protein
MSKVTVTLAPFVIVILILSALLLHGNGQRPPGYAVFAAHPSTGCPVTKPNGKAPLGQPHGSRTYGNDALSTTLFPNGVVEFRPGGPGFVLPDGSLKMKFPWWRKAEATLEVTGRRLDAAAPPLRAEIGGSTDVHMVPTYIIFPTTGCWSVTGKVGKASLVFVTKAIKVGNGP